MSAGKEPFDPDAVHFEPGELVLTMWDNYLLFPNKLGVFVERVSSYCALVFVNGRLVTQFIDEVVHVE